MYHTLDVAWLRCQFRNELRFYGDAGTGVLHQYHHGADAGSGVLY